MADVAPAPQLEGQISLEMMSQAVSPQSSTFSPSTTGCEAGIDQSLNILLDDVTAERRRQGEPGLDQCWPN
ncbi:hypothetical protein TNCT_503871 [Trichonephila clavata]|uniref:Uncharacterized protein n=1 Tax=Trichonephila clavata TaxID=2740835 RepID=A0A8X6GE04_TRICU|nr:hypothetical protein TNCT_503871 [Trichonephila clavata]